MTENWKFLAKLWTHWSRRCALATIYKQFTWEYSHQTFRKFYLVPTSKNVRHHLMSSWCRQTFAISREFPSTYSNIEPHPVFLKVNVIVDIFAMCGEGFSSHAPAVEVYDIQISHEMYNLFLGRDMKWKAHKFRSRATRVHFMSRVSKTLKYLRINSAYFTLLHPSSCQ